MSRPPRGLSIGWSDEYLSTIPGMTAGGQAGTD